MYQVFGRVESHAKEGLLQAQTIWTDNGGPEVILPPNRRFRVICEVDEGECGSGSHSWLVLT